MFLDAQTLLWDAAALDADAASTNTYDSGAAGNDISIGDELVLCIQVDVAADHTTGNETFEFQVIQSASANLGTPTVLASRTIDYTLLTAGSIHYIPIPPGSKTQRYLGAYFNGGGTTPTITVTAWFAPATMLQNDKQYADGFNIT